MSAVQDSGALEWQHFAVPEQPVRAASRLAPFVSLAGSEPDEAIADLAGFYGGRRWYSRPVTDDYRYRYDAIGDADLSVRRLQMHGYLRGDVAVDGEVVVQWIDAGTARIEVGQHQTRLQLGVPTLFPIERRFEMEYQDWDQRLVHISREFVLDVAAERYLVIGTVSFDREVIPPPDAVAAWRRAVAAAVTAVRDAGTASLVWHEAKRDVTRKLLDLYPFQAEPTPVGLNHSRNARVRTAVEFIHAHAGEPLTIADIAAASGLSVRGTQEAFQRALDTTPMAYLREVRLQRVREALRSAQLGDTTVADIAQRWGFGHLGRFAGEYRRRFGENPRRTLANH